MIMQWLKAPAMVPHQIPALTLTRCTSSSEYQFVFGYIILQYLSLPVCSRFMGCNHGGGTAHSGICRAKTQLQLSCPMALRDSPNTSSVGFCRKQLVKDLWASPEKEKLNQQMPHLYRPIRKLTGKGNKSSAFSGRSSELLRLR